MNAIITGATKGIGLAITRKFAAEGFSLCLCSRSLEDLNNLASIIESEYPNISIHTFQCDVSNKQSVQNFANFAIKEFNGKIDILVNNAGVFLPGEIIHEDDGQLEKTIETNLYSAYHLSRAVIPTMVSNQSGHIINMCSIASQIAYPNGGSYTISKFALLGFSKVLREELKDKGIRVTSILPGATWSNSWAGVELPEDRLMQASDIAKVVYTAIELSDSAVMEEVIIRPKLGDL